MNTIYFDESGYTGNNMMNKNQRIFILASHNYNQKECLYFKDNIFKIDRNIELKFSSFDKKDPIIQNRIIKFSNDKLIDENRIIYNVINKKYAILSQIVTLFVLPNNYDSEMLNYIATYMYRKHNKDSVIKFDKMFLNYEKLIMDKYKKLLIPFLDSVDELKIYVNNKYKKILDCIYKNINNVFSFIISDAKFLLDPTFASFASIYNRWDKKYNPVEIIYDESYVMKDYIKYLNELKKYDIINKYIKNFNSNDIRFLDSKTNEGIQISDILSGIVYYKWNIKNKNNKLYKLLCNSKLIRLTNIKCIFPYNRSILNNKRALDYILEII